MSSDDPSRRRSSRLVSGARKLDSVVGKIIEAVGFWMAVGMLGLSPWFVIEQLFGSSERVSVFPFLLGLHVTFLYLGRNYGRPRAG